METPATPEDESRRLEKLESLKAVYSPMEERFDQLTQTAKVAFNVQMCLISLVGDHIQWFKSAQGICVPETERAISFCGHAIHEIEPFVVEDASKDPRFADNPLVVEWPFIRFYAGAPLRVGGGSAIGTLCLIDPAPRSINDRDLELLKSFANLATQQLQSSINDDLQADFLSETSEKSREEAIHQTSRCWNLEAVQDLVRRCTESSDYQPTPKALLAVSIADYATLQREQPDDLDFIDWEIAKRLRSGLGATDLLGHWEEGRFLIFLRDRRTMQPTEFASLLMENVEFEPVEKEGVIIPVRINVAVIPLQLSSHSKFDSLLTIASRGLQQAANNDGLYRAEPFF